ncbi:MAG: lysophospholipid acyltransferase family protein [Hydrogenimonas sp.]|nr:lysophospholipid acyltransferase family protein [Hydrogenimonas sp.]
MRKRLLRKLSLWFIPPLGSLLIRFLYLTNKRRWHIAGDIPKTPIVVAFWHAELLLAPFIYKKIAPGRRVEVMISEHFDGEIIANTMKYFDIGAIRGSSSKGAAKALIQAIKRVKGGGDVAITPDGPKGPRHELSDGLVAIAKKTGAPVVIFNYRPSRYKQAKSWDRFLIPLPFGTIDFFCSEPIYIADMEPEEAKKLLRERMLEHAI